jgi:hypothetical protein
MRRAGIEKRFAPRKIGRCRAFRSRYAPKDSTFGERLRDQLAGRHKKLTALGAHQAQGRRSVLLLESRDLALMSPVMIVDALEAAFPTRPAGIDEIWFLHYVAPDTVNVHNLRSGGIWLYDLVAGKITLHNPDGPRVVRLIFDTFCRHDGQARDGAGS